METKQIDLAFEIKEVSEEGTFTGLASTYDNVDLGGDVVRPGAFTKTVKEMKSVPILDGHDPRRVLGEGVLRDGKEGLSIAGKLDIDIEPEAAKRHQQMKRGRIKGLSIGFTTIKDAVKDGVRELLELKVWEVSLTPFPMNPLAQVTAVKESALTAEPGSTPLEPHQPAPQAAVKNTEPDYHSALIEQIKRQQQEKQSWKN